MLLSIPRNSALVGAEVLFQGAVVDPNGPFLGLSSSDGLGVLVGR